MPLWTHTEHFTGPPQNTPALSCSHSASAPFPPLLLGIQYSCETLTLDSSRLLCLLSCVFFFFFSLCFGLVIFYWFIFDSPILYSAESIVLFNPPSSGTLLSDTVAFRSRMLILLFYRFQFPAQNFCVFIYNVHLFCIFCKISIIVILQPFSGH